MEAKPSKTTTVKFCLLTVSGETWLECIHIHIHCDTSYAEIMQRVHTELVTRHDKARELIGTNFIAIKAKADIHGDLWDLNIDLSIKGNTYDNI